MALLKLIPYNTNVDMVKYRFVFYAISLVIVLGSIGAYFTKGLNYGVDFKGGFVIEIRTPQPADLGKMRQQLDAMNLGGVKLQEFGSPNDVMIRVERQPGGDEAQMLAMNKIKAELGKDVEYRKIDTVGPTVSSELKKNAWISIILATIAMLIYISFRFEWQYGVAAIIALIQDCIAVIGLYAISGLEYNETAIIAILTTAGYSINDTVVIYDRIRENMRKYKKMEIRELINKSINETFSRTIYTSTTTLIAIICLYYFGGSVISSFSLPIMAGIIVGTYSSICVASMFLLFFDLGRNAGSVDVSKKNVAGVSKKKAVVQRDG